MPEENREIELANKIINIGHNNDCLFCGFKDKRCVEVLRQHNVAVSFQKTMSRQELQNLNFSKVYGNQEELPVIDHFEAKHRKGIK